MYLQNFQSIKPPYQKKQAESLNWLASVYKAAQHGQTNSEDEYTKLLKRVSCTEEQIQTRRFFIPDPLADDLDQQIIYPVKLNPRGITMEKRHEFYHQTVKNLFEEFYNTRKFPNDIIHVSCTGYISPSAAQMTALHSPHNVTVTHSYHMGCYGAFPALRMASGFLSSKEILGDKKSVDLVHTELCSLHMNPQDPTLEQMVIQSLFADGAIAYSLTSQKPERGFKLKSIHETLVPETSDAMEWMVSDWGMKMTLSKDVPTMIGKKIRQFTHDWLLERHENIDELIHDSIFAIHPGGPKIIDQVAKQLNLEEDQIQGSRKILKERGNMSSATLPHLWENILNDDSIPSGTPILSYAFGPGLTICSSLMEKL